MQSITEIIKPIRLLSGSHADTAKTGSGCFMNVVAYLNGEPQITDRSPCVCVTVRSIAIWLNDFLRDDERHEMIPYIERAMGSATDDATEMQRRLDRLVQFARAMGSAARAANAAYSAADATATAAAAAAAAAAYAADAAYSAADAAADAAAANAAYAAADAAAARAANAAYAAADARAAAYAAAHAAARAAAYAARAAHGHSDHLKALSRRRFAGCTGCSACRRRPRSRPRCIGGLNARPPHAHPSTCRHMGRGRASIRAGSRGCASWGNCAASHRRSTA